MNIIEYIKYMHLYERNIRNKESDAPSISEMMLFINNLDTGWYLSPEYLNVFHDDKQNLPELKFLNLDGREYVYKAHINGIYNLELDEKYKGTYNYFPPIYNKKNKWFTEIFMFLYRILGHLVFDVLPYYIL